MWWSYEMTTPGEKNGLPSIPEGIQQAPHYYRQLIERIALCMGADLDPRAVVGLLRPNEVADILSVGAWYVMQELAAIEDAEADEES
jgi:hypothetical protein